jgi:hypothetical protein
LKSNPSSSADQSNSPFELQRTLWSYKALRTTITYSKFHRT